MVAVSLLKGIGSVNARKLINEFGSAEAVFTEAPAYLKKWRQLPDVLRQLQDQEIFEKADLEIDYCHKQGIRIISFNNPAYPDRLKSCYDAPLVLYVKGDTDLNLHRMISIVGTRKCTDYGQRACGNIVAELRSSGVGVVSGLALGIDTVAHQSALENGLKTFAVLGHALNKIYPSQNRELSKEIINSGALISDFPTTATMVPGNFASRNRIVAGMTDATLVIESDIRGGSLITADIAHSYNRDVFAVPGNVGSRKSAGCNGIIKNQKAVLIESAQDIMENMGWTKIKVNRHVQQDLFETLTEEERALCGMLREKGASRIDEISIHTGQSINTSSCILLSLELKRMVKSMPGKIYALTS